jgi:23S rRNA (uracil1939-C5)-methyltransferase
MKRAPEIEVALDGLAAGGDAVGRDAEGRVTFVAGGAPGERVRARIVETHKKWARGELVAVLAPSTARVEPACPYAAARTCGGCPWMHVTRDAQVAAKQANVASALRKLVARGLELAPIVTPAPDLGWRRRARLQLDGDVVGFHAPRSNAVTDIARCLQLDPRLDAAIQAARPSLRGTRGELHAAIGHAGDVQLVAVEQGRRTIVAGPARLELEPGLATDADEFAQASAEGNAALVSAMLAALQPHAGQRVLELFAGAGNFTRHLLAAGAHVTANELAATAPAGATLEPGRAEEAVARVAARGDRFDAVLLDPPRTGALDAARALAAWRDAPSRVVYVACDLATAARDLEILAAAGWNPRRAVPLDLMPQTAHVEVVALVERT